ncbi:MAG: Two component regulator, sensor protein, partial [Xanthomonadaceae bacterium]|nr:Two component regulator, sensor protein [Xanthomonadaceae bacterium]
TWDMDDGLPHNGVTRILEAKDGYLWVGTQAGLARFDGVRFTVFNHSNTLALQSDFITDLVEDRHGTLWIATLSKGVAFFREGRFTHLDAISAREGLSLAADKDGSVWVGGSDGLKHVVNDVVVKRYTTADGLAHDSIKRVVMDRNGGLWIATAVGLNRLVNGRITTFTTSDGLANNDITGLYSDTDGTIWVKTQNADVARLINGRFVPLHLPGVLGATVRAVTHDHNGNMWIASGTEGLLRVVGQHVDRFSTINGLSNDAMTCLYEDREGNLWGGTNGGGMQRFRDGSFTTYAKEEGLSSDPAYAVIQDTSGDIWVSTSTGLNRLRGSAIDTFTATDKLADAWSLLEDDHSNLLVGTSAKGVIRMANAQLVPMLSAPDGIPPYMMSAIIEDRGHQIWMATRGAGLIRYGSKPVSAYTTADGLLANGVYALAEGAGGTIWVGTENGLNSIADGRISHYPGVKGLANAFVVSLYFNADNTLWIGTMDRGLFRLQNGRFTQYTTHQGLLDDGVNSIVEDADRNLWLGSINGISRISRSDLDAVAAGKSPSVQAVSFGKADGMKSSETNGGTQPGAWRAHDGRLWFVTGRGVAVVDPSKLLLDQRAPPARIEDMAADQLPVNLLAPLRFAPGTRRFEIRYTAPSLSDPQRTQFRYRLEGFDPQWIVGRAQRLAQYTNLSPGHYTFRVNARSQTGAWNGQEATLDFDLMPRFYQTLWFQLLCALTGLFVLWGAYRLRVNWLHARAAVLEERQRIAGDIHDSLAQGLSGIIFQTEAALFTMPPGIATTRVTTARDLAKSSLDDARYSVWNLSPPVLDHNDLVESLASMTRQLASGRVDELFVTSSGSAWVMRPEANHHVVLVAQEALSNAIQHGHAHRISIELAYMPDGLHLGVLDDGVGFTPTPVAPATARGYGLRNMHHRAQRLGAKLEVTSEIGRGTRVSLYIPRLGRIASLWRRLLGQGMARIDG